MNNCAIHCEALSKRYRLGEPANRNLREALMRRLRAPFRRHENRNGTETMWALRDVSFDVHEGEVVGIIGRNGAGKSTLLKLLSRITEPTEGFAEVRGRVGSLLEVGTGFHHELTGRDNIFLNGAILGMRKQEIERKFDEIVEFAEIEKFLDTPVKHYSSGMYVRLAFSVAAHLEPEILLVDEVLAVGDAQFQKKCLGRMSTVAREGRTIVFVSHNMGAINRLCSRCLWIDGGYLKAEGPTSSVVTSYISENIEEGAERRWPGADAPGTQEVRLRAVRICQPPGRASSAVDIRSPFDVEIEIEVLTEEIEELGIGIQITAVDGQIVFHSSDLFCGGKRVLSGAQRSTCTLPPYALNAGRYSLAVGADRPNRDMPFFEEAVVSWSVEPLCPVMGRYDSIAWKGVLGPGLGRWSTTKVPVETV
jgi:lipopolysaccharide transport system ATP-binding protein